MFFSTIDVPYTYTLVDNPKKLSWLYKELVNSTNFATDIETNHPTVKSNKKPANFEEKVAGISFAWGRDKVENPWNPGMAAYIPLIKADDSDFWKSRQGTVLQVTKDILESDIPKEGQNIKFDTYKLCNLLKIKIKNVVHDTYLSHTLLDEERRYCSHALKSDYGKDGKTIIKLGLVDHYLNLGNSAFKKDLQSALNFYDPEYKRYSKVPLDILYPYGCSDSDFVHSLRFIFDPLIDQEGMRWLYDNLIMRLSHTLTLMELHGVPLDINRAKEVVAEQQVIMDQKTSEVAQMVGQTINVGSDTQLGKFLFDKLGLPAARNERGAYKTDADYLKTLDHPVIQPILEYRRASKIHGSFASPALEAVEQVTDNGKIGWVHVKFFMDTLTGRISTTDPNLSAQPRKENGGNIVKSMWYGGEDYRFVFRDFSQVELRMIAHCSQEPVWIEGFKAGYDMHAAMAQRIWHKDCTVDEVKEKFGASRSKAKAVNFGIAFGKSEYSLSKDLGMTEDEAHKLIHEEYYGTAPVLKSWIDNMHAYAEYHGQVSNIFGRIRHLSDAQLDVPDGVYWPKKDQRPKCYAKGPKPTNLNIDPYDLYNVTENQIFDQIKTVGHEWMIKCLSCPHVHTCFINTYSREMSSRKAKAMRQSVNAPIQGGAVDMTSLALTWISDDLQAEKLPAMPILHIHDELCVFSHISAIEKVDRIMTHCMEIRMQEFLNFTVPLVTDPACVSRWSHK